MLEGSVQSLSNVYSVSFLAVMALFAAGNMLLKYKRSFLPREVKSTWPNVIISFSLVIFALCGTLAKQPDVLLYFCIYFFGTGSLVAVMFCRVQTLKILYSVLRGICRGFGIENARIVDYIGVKIVEINNQTVAFFSKHGSLSVLNKAILYVRQNEDCKWIRIIHVYEDENNIPEKLEANIKVLDECYPKLKIDLVLVQGIYTKQSYMCTKFIM